MLGLQEELPFDQFKRYRALRLTQNPFHIFSEFLLPFWLATAHNSQIPSTSLVIMLRSTLFLEVWKWYFSRSGFFRPIQLRTEYYRTGWLVYMETDPMNRKNTSYINKRAGIINNQLNFSIFSYFIINKIIFINNKILLLYIIILLIIIYIYYLFTIIIRL